MTDYPEILYAVHERVATITLNRPDRLNAYTGTMADSIKRAMAAANNESDVRAIVITGAGRGFCAGADMSILSRQAQAGRGRSGQVEMEDVDTKFGAVLGPDLSIDIRDAERFGYFA